MAHDFDVFVSYKSEYLPWVEVLARNLQRQGFSVWLDEWQLKAAERVNPALEAGLDSCASAVLVVTPEAAQSGWVQSEYDRMRLRQRRGDGFRLVPLILRATTGFAFLDELKAVDFQQATTPDLYRRRLHEVVRGLRGEAPGEGHDLTGEIELPPPLDAPPSGASGGVFDTLLDDVARQRIAAVFMQEGADRLLPVESLLDAARRRFPRTELRHVVPPSCGDEHTSAYFAWIGRMCGLGDAVSDAFTFGSALAARLHTGTQYLLVVSHMENGPPAARRAFAAQLAQAFDLHRGRLSLLFLGGERLDELVFHGNHDMSLLNKAAPTAHDWPMADVADLRLAAGAAELPAAEAEMLIDATGGETRLLAECLRRRPAMRQPSAASYRAVIGESAVVRQWFAPIAVDPAAAQRVCRLLEQDEPRPFSRIRTDDALRRLYWRGALRKVTDANGVDRLAWRCPAARDAGKRVLRCDHG